MRPSSNSMADFVFSIHASEQMKLRSIDEHVVLTILNNPEKIILEEGVSIYQSVVFMDDKFYLIRIFVNEKLTPHKVVTVYKTSKINKYNEG